MIASRRRFLFGAATSLIAAPAIVRVAANLMPVSSLHDEMRRKAEFIEKLIRPPLICDPMLKCEPASIMPGMITYVNALNGRTPFAPAFEVLPRGLLRL
jgi:hypothetical protein